MNIENRLKQIYNAYNGNGNKEIALFLTDKWTLHVGNPSMHVQLGEVKGEHCFEASSLQEVLATAENVLLPKVHLDFECKPGRILHLPHRHSHVTDIHNHTYEVHPTQAQPSHKLQRYQVGRQLSNDSTG